MQTCKCLKCGKDFQSDNKVAIAGDGYCEPCNEARLAIAKEVDARFGKREHPKGPAIDSLPTIPNKRFSHGMIPWNALK